MRAKLFIYLLFLLFTQTLVIPLFSQTLAFPEAVGFGRYATGGRNGEVYHVTNLNDSGEGSFRDAVSKSDRIVVFDVGGYVRLETAVQIQSNITIAGQTAPGDGIGFMGGKISCGSKSNIIIRHIKIRPGDFTASQKDDGLNMYKSKNCIVDHCSVEFSPWNNIGGSGTNADKSTDITFQSCLIANPIYQQFGAHIESVNSQWTWYANCFANTHNRNPLDKVNDIFVNNVLYNYQGGYTTHTSTKFSHDIINNYFVGGPTSGSTDNTWFQVDKNQSIYYSGNMKDRNKDGVLNGAETTPYWYQGAGTILTEPWSEVTKTIPTHSAATAFRMVASLCGAQPVDQIDSLVWRDVRSIGTLGAMYKSQTITGLANDGYGIIDPGVAESDSDGDGMPDYWELANDLDATSDDAMTIGSDGYANIERYINWLGTLHERVDANGVLSLDLSKYTQGWNGVSPSYTVSNAVNGTVSVSNSKVSFYPATNYYGLASFDFTVKGNDGTQFTTKIHVLVLKGEEIVFENPSLVKQGAGSSSQTITTHSPLVNYSFAWENAITVDVKWEPSIPEGISTTIDRVAKKVTFSAQSLPCGTYRYVVSTVGATTTATKSGTITVLPRAYVYYNEGTSSDWTDTTLWIPNYLPTNCDTAIVRKGEAKVSMDIESPIYVEPEGIFRLRSDVKVGEMHIQGGTLKSYTSNPLFVLTAEELLVEEASTFHCGSIPTSEFQIKGLLTGEGDITKTHVGILTLMADASSYTGRWTLADGTINVAVANGLGSNGIDVKDTATLKISATSTTETVTVAESAALILDADLTVEMATLGADQLVAGTYTAADYPAIISGEGKLIVSKGAEGTAVQLNSTEEFQIELAPNPIVGETELIILTNQSEKCRLEIFDLSSRIVYENEVELARGRNRVLLDLSFLKVGTYIINITTSEVSKILKVCSIN